MRRGLHEMGWVWKWAQLVAKDDDPHRIARLGRIRFVCEQIKLCEALVFADEVDIHLLLTGGLYLDAQRDPAGGHDSRPEPEALPRRGSGSDYRDAAPRPGATQHPCAVPGAARSPRLVLSRRAGYPALWGRR
jgi:hypothetical protein